MEQKSQRNKEEEVAYWLSQIHLQPLTPSAPPLPLAQSSPAKSYCGSSGTSSGGRSRHVSFNSAESGYSSPARSLPPRRRQISSNSTAPAIATARTADKPALRQRTACSFSRMTDGNE